jgi:DNA polymerase III subunit gamma/tau
MSYQVLARKWRPSNFSQVAGQGHVLKSLINALDNQRLHHAYLFTGTRGVGKTTLARILAKCLNCENGISSTPCEQCDSCVEINEGRFIDLIEVDAASRTKVEDTRDLLDNVQYAPTRGRFKVYLIDEVHMLSTHSFNALLKTLEEPPPHVKFLLATTDPQKLPITVLSRCLQFNLKNLSPQTIVTYLEKVLQDEKLNSDETALWQIAAAAAGSMRDALTLVDQAIAYCQGEVTSAGVVEMLGVPEQQQVYALLDAMASRNILSVIELVNTIAEQTPDYVHTLDSLLSAFHRIALAQVVPDAVDNSFGDREQVRTLAGKYSAEDIQLYYQIGLKGREELRLAADLRSAFEMLLIRMLVFSPEYTDLSGQTAEPDESGETPVLEPEESVSSQASLGSAQKKKNQQESVSAEEPAPDQPMHEAEIKVEASPAAEHQPSQPATTPELVALTHESWVDIYPALPVTGIAANILANTELQRIEGNCIYLLLDKSQSAVYNESIVPKLAQALSEYFQQQLELRIEIGQVDAETSAGKGQRERQERHIELVSNFEQDENVQQLLKHFSGTVAKDSIAPVKD